jgi:hypothetical protein
MALRLCVARRSMPKQARGGVGGVRVLCSRDGICSGRERYYKKIGGYLSNRVP